MSYYLCFNCGEIYNSKFLALQGKEYEHCPKASCLGPIAEIDELMLPIIKKLFDLGYRTEYCCSGHSFEDFIGSYIDFCTLSDKEYEILFENLPYSWEVKFFNDNYIIYPKNQDFNNENDMISKQRQIFGLISDLMDWVEKLPKVEEEDIA